MNQSELKEKYMNIITAEVWQNDMKLQDYARKECAQVVEIENGDIISIDKPRIKTRFCFGFGIYGRSTDEEEHRASACEENARTNIDYFMKENLEEIERNIKALKDTSRKAYKYLHYTGQPKESKLKTFSTCRLCDSPEYEPGRWSNLEAMEELTQNERNLIVAGYEEVKKAFIKRLATYLKKYGLTKLDTWTYLVD